MRILIVSYFFPPYNSIGAVRVGKTAKFLVRAGHEVRVVTAADQPLAADLPVEIDPAHVTATSWWDMDRPVRVLLGGRQRGADHGLGDRAAGRVGRHARSAYQAIVHLPDGEAGWYAPAVRASLRVARSWRPDVILSSALPFTSHRVAERVARKTGTPWVAEFRDLWAESPYADAPRWRRRLDAAWECRVMRPACGLVTVSEPLAESLVERHGKPVAVVMNGFDPEDEPGPGPHPDARGLVIVYTGMIYSGRRDPAPLFAAISLLPHDVRDDVRVELYGRNLATVERAARAHGVEHLVRCYSQVPRVQALRAQRAADLLLFLAWDDPGERGYLTGKLFEYLAAQRPILAIGAGQSAAGRLIRELGAGELADEPEAIAQIILDHVVAKRAGKRVAGADPSRIARYTREAQTAKLVAFLEERLAHR